MILWIIIAVLWTVLVLMAGYSSGKAVAKKEFEDAIAKTEDDEPHWSSGVRGQVGPAGEPGPMGPPGEPGEPGACEHEADVDKLLMHDDDHERRLALVEETISGFRDRFTRVERKAGMSV